MTGEYSIEFLPAARRQLKKLPKPAQKKIASLLDELSIDPRPLNCKFLQGPLKGFVRVRSGDYRIIYSIQDDKLIVFIVKIGARKDVYE